MKLILSVVAERDKNKVTDALLRSGFPFTQIGSTGGFLHEGNVTLLCGVETRDVDRFLEVVRGCCQARPLHVSDLLLHSDMRDTFLPEPAPIVAGGGVCFVIPIERFERC